MHLDILGVRVDNISRKEALERVKDFLDEPGMKQIVTINPEFIVGAQEDKKFKKIINDAELNVADGIGIKLAFLRFGKFLKKRLSGADLVWDILKIANERKLKIFLLANEEGLSSWQDTAMAIKRVYPKMRISGSNESISVCYFESEVLDKVDEIKSSDILFCNFGAPCQEKFINSLKKFNTKIKIGIGVGGTFDFISGKVIRAPKWIRTFGFEWLWRLALKPDRLRRTFRAVVIFPIRIILNK